jgi:hypothetical protein
VCSGWPGGRMERTGGRPRGHERGERESL